MRRLAFSAKHSAEQMHFASLFVSNALPQIEQILIMTKSLPHMLDAFALLRLLSVIPAVESTHQISSHTPYSFKLFAVCRPVQVNAAVGAFANIKVGQFVFHVYADVVYIALGFLARQVRVVIFTPSITIQSPPVVKVADKLVGFSEYNACDNIGAASKFLTCFPWK